MRKRFKIPVFSVIFFVFVFLSTGCGSDNTTSTSNGGGDEDLPNMEMTIGHAESGDPSNHIHAGALAFKEYVEENSDNKITVNISSGGALGDAIEMMEQVRSGTLEVSASLSGESLISVYPNMAMWTIPYLFDDEEEALSVYKGTFGEKMWKDFTNETGLKPLVRISGGFRMLTNNKHPIKVPEDVKGLQFRTMDVSPHMEFFKTLGATPTPISWDELYAALQTGVVDGHENGIPAIVIGNIYEVQDYLSLNGYVWTQEVFLTNKKWLNDQPKEYQDIIIKAGKRAEEVTQNRANEIIEESLDLLKEEMEVYEPTSDEVKMFKNAVQGPVIEHIKEKVDDPELVDELIKESESTDAS